MICRRTPSGCPGAAPLPRPAPPGRRGPAAALAALALCLPLSAPAAAEPLSEKARAATTEPSRAPAAPVTSTLLSSGPPLSLQEALETALARHPQVAAAVATEDAAAARVGQARAPWLPQVNLSGQLSDRYNYNFDTSRNDVIYGAQASLSQLIYDFGRTSGRIDAAKAGARAAAGDRQNTQAQIALGAVSAYYAVLRAEALYEVALQNQRQQEQRLRQAESFVQIGTRPEIDAVTARTGVAQAELQQVQARNAALLARVQLLQAMGVTDASWLGRPLSAAPPAPLPEEVREVDALLEQALSDRPDYQALRERVAQAEAQVRALRGDYLPQLSLGGNAGFTGTSTTAGGSTMGGIVFGSGGVTQAGLTVSGVLQLSWSPFSGLSTRYAVREAEANARVARANLELLRQQARSAIQQALYSVQNSRQALGSAAAVQTQAERQLALASGRYDAGVGNIIELGDAQVGATQARAQRVQADFDLALARAALRLQLGQVHRRESAPAGRGEGAAPAPKESSR